MKTKDTASKEHIVDIGIREGDFTAPSWMNANHYHCKKCLGEIEFLAGLPHRDTEGVSRLGICRSCHLLLVEYERSWWFKMGKLKWIKF